LNYQHQLTDYQVVNYRTNPWRLITFKNNFQFFSDEKATNSKNMGKINKLLPFMQEHLGKTTKGCVVIQTRKLNRAYAREIIQII
jgi:hypothetical protein